MADNRDRFNDGGDDALGGSEYFTGGCGCGGVEGGSLKDVGSGLWSTYAKLGSLMDDPMVIVSDAVIVTAVLLSIVILVLYMFFDINMFAYAVTMAIITCIAVAVRIAGGFWDGRPGKNKVGAPVSPLDVLVS